MTYAIAYALITAAAPALAFYGACKWLGLISSSKSAPRSNRASRRVVRFGSDKMVQDAWREWNGA